MLAKFAPKKRPHAARQNTQHRLWGINMNQLTVEPLRALTRRRRQVATLVSKGLSNRAVAEKLGLTEGTIKVHLHAIYEKLDVHSRDELTTALTK